MEKPKYYKAKKENRVTLMHKKAFLAAYAIMGSIKNAAKACGIDPSRHHAWMLQEDYKKQFSEAQDRATVYLEDIAVQRATEGWEEPIFYQGKQCGTVRKFSDTLLIFTLKALRPDKYRERYDHNHSGNVSSTINIVDYSTVGKMEKNGANSDK